MARLSYKSSQMDEGKKPDGEAKPKAEAEVKAKSETKEEPKEEPKAEGSDGKGDMGAKHAEERAEMRKRHETEIRDHNGNQRDARRKIDDRHMAEAKAMSEKQDAEMTAGADPTLPGGGPPLPTAAAPGAAAQE